MNLNRLLRWQPFTPWVFLTAVGVALIIVAVIVMSVVNGAREKAQDRVNDEMGKARAKAAKEASAIIERSQDFQAASDSLSRDNEYAIRNAPGADYRLAPALNDAARRRLCERPSLRGTPDCVQLVGPQKPSR